MPDRFSDTVATNMVTMFRQQASSISDIKDDLRQQASSISDIKDDLRQLASSISDVKDDLKSLKQDIQNIKKLLESKYSSPKVVIVKYGKKLWQWKVYPEVGGEHYYPELVETIRKKWHLNEFDIKYKKRFLVTEKNVCTIADTGSAVLEICAKK